MKLVQVYCTFEGERRSAGFTTTRSLKKYMANSSKAHSDMYDVHLYTDTVGKSTLEDVLDPRVTIHVMEFPLIDDRFWYLPKLQACSTIGEPFMYCDLDVTLYKKVDTIQPNEVLVEQLRVPSTLGMYTKVLQVPVPPTHEIPCSGILGFGDVSWYQEYFDEVLKCVDRANCLPEINLTVLYVSEELTLSSVALRNNKSFISLSQVDYEHLVGGRK